MCLLVLALAQVAFGTWVEEVEEWAQFKLAHGKTYADQFIELKHMQTYSANKAYIAKHNAQATLASTPTDWASTSMPT